MADPILMLSLRRFLACYALSLILAGWPVAQAMEGNESGPIEAGKLPQDIRLDLDRSGYRVDTTARYREFHVLTAHPAQQSQGYHPEGKILLIYRQSRQVLKRVAPEGERFFRWLNTIQMGPDVTGQGQPNAVVQTWSGGAHCCFSLQVYTLAATPHWVASIDLMHSDEAGEFLFPQHGHPIIEVADWAFAYAYTDFADSPTVPVLLRFNGQRFALANELMHWDRGLNAPAIWRLDPVLAGQLFAVSDQDEAEKKPATLDDYQQDRRELEAHLLGWLPAVVKKDAGAARAQLVNAVNPLIYGGDIEEAKRLLDRLWPKDLAGKTQFWKIYRGHLQKSLYWRDLIQAYPDLLKLGR